MSQAQRYLEEPLQVYYAALQFSQQGVYLHFPQPGMYRRTIETNFSFMKRKRYKIFATPEDQLPEVEPTQYIFYATLEALST